MSPYDKRQPYDPNIIEALACLPKEMMNDKGKIVYIRGKAGRETSYEHIANTGHGLQVRDVLRIPGILANPEHVCKDPSYPKTKLNYYGKKYKRNQLVGYIKIVTTKTPSGREEIVTVYFTKRIKDNK